jgi:uncharacterized membrane protein (UPF0136 family)
MTSAAAGSVDADVAAGAQLAHDDRGVGLVLSIALALVLLVALAVRLLFARFAHAIWQPRVSR